MNEVQQVTQPGQNQESQAQTAPAEPLALTQSEANKIIGSARQEARQKGYEMGYNEALTKLQNQPNPQSAIDEKRARDIAEQALTEKLKALEEQARKEAAIQHGNKILNELGAKITQDKQSIPDFDNVVKLQNFQNVPEILHLANTVDNSGHVLYDLKQNPIKMGAIVSLVRNGMTDDAISEMKKLSDSIKVNQAAINQPRSPEPLNQIKPSNIGLGNGSKKSVADLRRDPSYRG